MKFSQQLQLPKIPEELETKIIKLPTLGVEPVSVARDKSYYDRILTKNENSYKSNRTFRYPLAHVPEVKTWIDHNIMRSWHEADVNMINRESPSLGPHCDLGVSHRLLYLLETGGENVETVWWQELGKNIYPDLGHWVADYNQLVELERISLKKRQWYLIDTRVLHSVENLETDRVAIQISMKSCQELRDLYKISMND